MNEPIGMNDDFESDPDSLPPGEWWVAIIGDTLVPGADWDAVKAAIAQARARR